MTEIIRYSLVGKEDLALGIGTFEVRLADGRVVALSKIDIGALLNDATISTQTLAIVTLSVGTLTVTSGVTLTGATVAGALTLTGGQIAFPAAQVPSAGANTLDDYEEGTWTPSVGGTATYTTQDGTYVKIGKLVFVTVSLTINVLGTGSNAVISGLPFVSDTNGALAVTGMLTLADSVVFISGRVLASQTLIYLNSLLAAGTDVGTNAVLGNGTNVEVSGCYVTT